jgi:oligopeptide transport system substrate-binding protein
MGMNKKVTRREFLKVGGLMAGGAALLAITPKVVAQTIQVIPKIYLPIVQKDYNPYITPQGKVLPPDAAPVAKQIYTSAGVGEPQTFDGTLVYSTGGLGLINETLLRSDENMTTVPSLAESWRAGPNATYWEFTIQQGAVWSDGVPITADDIVYTFLHIADPAMGNPFLWFFFDIKGVSGVAGGGDPALISDPLTGGVRKIDNRTVRIYGAGPSPDGDPCAYLPALLSYQAAAIVPKHVVVTDPQHWADNGVGMVSGGPYLCTLWEHHVKIEYQINPKYNRPFKPNIQKVVTPIAGSGYNSFTAFLSKEVDLIPMLDAGQVASVRGMPKYNPLMRWFNNFQTEYLSLNTYMPPLDNLKLRQALSHAIDRVTLCSAVLNNTYRPAFSMLPPGFPAYNPDLAPVQAFDVSTAQSLLADAGYPGGVDGLGHQLELTLYANGPDPKLAFVKQQWETNLGIKVTLNEIDYNTWSTMRANHQMMVYKGPYEYDYIDPANLLAALWHSTPHGGTPASQWGSPRHPWYSAQFDQLCDQARVEADVPTRMQKFQDAESILVSNVGGIFLTHQIVFQIWYPWIAGIPANHAGDVVFRWMDISLFQMYIHKDVDAMKAQY